MKKFGLALAVLAVSFFAIGELRADGCYLCGSGSTAACKDYCKYTGSDTWDNRKKCESAGCKVSGTSSCPSASNYKVCSAQLTVPKTFAEFMAMNQN